MALGIALHPDPSTTNVADNIVEQASAAQAMGIGSIWLSQQFAHDPIVLATLVAARLPNIKIGTSVVTLAPRHPISLAAQAKTVQAASHGRFTLGIGLGAATLEDPIFGTNGDRPALRLREYLAVLRPLLDGESEPFVGETVTSRPPPATAVAGGEDVPILVAAMGPRALQVAGELADGVVPLFAGPNTLGDYLVPALERASAGRATAPAVVAGVAVVITSDPDRVRAKAAEQMAFYDTIPSYQRVVAREGFEHASQLAVVGDEKRVYEQLQRYRGAGATDLLITQTAMGGPEDRRRTWEFLGTIADEF